MLLEKKAIENENCMTVRHIHFHAVNLSNAQSSALNFGTFCVKIENCTLYFISAQVITFINHARCINSFYSNLFEMQTLWYRVQLSTNTHTQGVIGGKKEKQRHSWKACMRTCWTVSHWNSSRIQMRKRCVLFLSFSFSFSFFCDCCHQC